jgi:nicotinate phosphoribosyltransferase
MSFGSEEEAFAAYAELYPAFPVFLLDTYDTLKSGLVNAIKIGKQLKNAGKNFGVRLDSGDLYYLTVEVRKRLDEAGLKDAKISVSNDLDERIIEALVDEGAPIDSWGVGTRMVTGGDESAFTGVYKLAAFDEGDGVLVPAMKLSDNPEKTTNPAVKQVWRIHDKAGSPVADIMTVDNLDNPDASEMLAKGQSYQFWHPQTDYRHFDYTIEGRAEALLKKRMEKGVIIEEKTPLPEIQKRAAASLARFDTTYKRFLNPHIYKVSITEQLRNLKISLLAKKFTQN